MYDILLPELRWIIRLLLDVRSRARLAVTCEMAHTEDPGPLLPYPPAAVFLAQCSTMDANAFTRFLNHAYSEMVYNKLHERPGAAVVINPTFSNNISINFFWRGERLAAGSLSSAACIDTLIVVYQWGTQTDNKALRNAARARQSPWPPWWHSFISEDTSTRSITLISDYTRPLADLSTLDRHGRFDV